MQKNADKDAFNGATARITAGMIKPDGSLKITPDYFTNLGKAAMMPHADVPEIRSMVSFGRETLKRQADGTDVQTDPHTYTDFQRRANLPVGDPQALTLKDVYNAAAEGKLDSHDMGFFKGWVSESGKNPQKVAQNKLLTDFTHSLRGFITGTNPLLGKADSARRFALCRLPARHDRPILGRCCVG